MTLVRLVPVLLAVAGCVAQAYAMACERRMQRYRLPGVSCWTATLRWDGGWRRADLFAPEGLALQRRASRFALRGVGWWTLAALSWALVLKLGW
ncbi:MAG: hypothetical protein HY700_05760 [Gemmatimonadetes bacterium]|nr:hypothetical protein [Gemmatimonadota bacterium]